MLVKHPTPVVIDYAYSAGCIQRLIPDKRCGAQVLEQLADCVSLSGMSARVFAATVARLSSTHAPSHRHAVLLIRQRFGNDVILEGAGSSSGRVDGFADVDELLATDAGHGSLSPEQRMLHLAWHVSRLERVKDEENQDANRLKLFPRATDEPTIWPLKLAAISRHHDSTSTAETDTAEYAMKSLVCFTGFEKHGCQSEPSRLLFQALFQLYTGSASLQQLIVSRVIDIATSDPTFIPNSLDFARSLEYLDNNNSFVILRALCNNLANVADSSVAAHISQFTLLMSRLAVHKRIDPSLYLEKLSSVCFVLFAFVHATLQNIPNNLLYALDRYFAIRTFATRHLGILGRLYCLFVGFY